MNAAEHSPRLRNWRSQWVFTIHHGLSHPLLTSVFSPRSGFRHYSRNTLGKSGGRRRSCSQLAERAIRSRIGSGTLVRFIFHGGCNRNRTCDALGRSPLQTGVFVYASLHPSKMTLSQTRHLAINSSDCYPPTRRGHPWSPHDMCRGLSPHCAWLPGRL